MKRYIIFAGLSVKGGWDDVVRDKNNEVCSFDTEGKAYSYACTEEKVIDADFDGWAQIVDLQTGSIVWQY